MADIKTNQSKLYNALKRVGFKDLGSEEQFAGRLQDAGNRQKLYKALQKQGFNDLGDYESFESRIYQPQGPVRIDNGVGSGAATESRPTGKGAVKGQGLQQETPATMSPGTEPSARTDVEADVEAGADAGAYAARAMLSRLKKEGTTKGEGGQTAGKTQAAGGGKPFELSWQDRAAAGMTLGGAKGALANVDAGVQRLQKAGSLGVTPYGIGEAGLGHNKNLRKGNKKFNAEKGAFEDTWVTLDGREFSDLRQADAAQDNMDALIGHSRYKEQLKALGMDVKEEGEEEKSIAEQLRDAYRERMELERQIAQGRGAEAGRIARGALIGSAALDRTDREASNEQSNLLSAKRLLDRRIDALEAERDDAGYWRGTGDVLGDASTWSFGLTDASDALQMDKLKDKIDSGQALSDSEKTLARNYLMNEEAQLLNQNRGAMYGYGQMFGGTLAFMADFALTGGGFASVAKKGLRMGTKAGLKYAGSNMAAFMTKNLGKAGNVINKTLQYGAKYGGLAAGAEVGGALGANTVGLARTATDIMNRHRGELTFDKDGNLSFKDGQSLAKSILFGEAENIGEYASELVGPAFDVIPGLVGRILKNKLGQEWLKRLAGSKVWRGGEKTLDFLGVQSLFGEGMEEEAGMLRTGFLNYLTGGEFDPNAPSITDVGAHLETWAATALTCGMLRAPQMIHAGIGQAQYYGNKYNLNRSDERMEDVFGIDATDFSRYKQVKDSLDGADNELLAGVLHELMERGGLSTEEKKAVFQYADDLVQLRGYNLGNVVAAANGFKEPPRVSGYNIKGNTVEEVDEKGNVLSTHEYDDRESMKAGLYELQQQRYDKNLQSDRAIMRVRPDDQYVNMAVQYCADNDLLLEDFEAMLDKPSMERSEEEQQLVAPFAQQLHDAVYDKTMLHEEQSQQDGEEIADAESIDIEGGGSDDGAQIMSAWKQAEQARQELFSRNEDLREEVERLEGEGLSHQEVLSSLDSFRRDDVQTVIDYYNQKARLEGYMNRKAQKIAEEAKNSRDRHAFKGTINGTADLGNVYTISNGENNYYLVSGNVTTDAATGRITGSDSGLIIGVDGDGNFVQIGDGEGYSVMPVTQSLDQFEEAERVRLEVAVSAGIDPDGAQAEQEAAAQQQPTGKGAALTTPHTETDGAAILSPGTEEETLPPPTEADLDAMLGTVQGEGQTQGQAQGEVQAQPQGEAQGGTQAQGEPVQGAGITIESVTGDDGVKRYERGIGVDDAIADMEKDGLDVSAEADLAISEAQSELGKMGEAKTRAERVKNAARRQELEGTIAYYEQLKQRYGELHPTYADAQPFIDRLNGARSRRQADEILNEALQAGVNPSEIRDLHTQKVSDIITREEEARRRADEITDSDRRNIMTDGGTVEGRARLLDGKRGTSAEKRRKLAKEIYGDYFDDDFDAWRDIKELISQWLSKGRALDPDTFGQELGWDMGVGKDAAKVSTMFAKRRENGGDGMLFNDFVHMVAEASGGRYDTQDVRNALIGMFQGAQEKSDLTEYQLKTRIAEAEARIAEETRRAEEAEGDAAAQHQPTGQPQDGVVDGMLPFAPMNENEERPAFLGEDKPHEMTEEDNKDTKKTDTNQESEQKTLSREEYLTSHPLTEEQIMADTEATEDEKLNAIDFLRGEDDSAISRFYYDSIYERAQNFSFVPKEEETNPFDALLEERENERKKKEEKDKAVREAYDKERKKRLGTAADPMEAIEQAAQSFREEQKSKDQQDIDDALKEFNDFLDGAKGSSVLDKFMRKGLEGNDKAQANLLDAFTLTNEAQRMFLKDLLRLASKVGYAYIKSGVHDAQAWSKKMSESIGAKLREVLGWDDAIIGEFVDEVWNQKYTVDGQRMRLSEHAERLKNNKPADNSVNVNKQEDNEPEKDLSLQQEPASELEGDSAEFAERQEKVAKLREDIGRKLRQAVLTDDNQIKTMQSVKALATQYGLDDISMTDLQELVEAEIVELARTVAQSEEWSEQQKFDYIVKLYNSQPSLNARDNDRINKQQYSTPAPMAFLMGKFLKEGKEVKSGLEPSAGNGMLTLNLPKEAMHVNDIDEMRLSNLAKQGFAEVTSQDGTQPFGEKKYDVVVTNPPFGNVPAKTYDGLYEISGLEHQMAINALESMKDDGRAAIIIGGNTEYNQNGSIKGKDRAFFNYLYAHYNVVDVINMDGHELYSRQGTGFPVRMILINGRREFNPKNFAPVESKARAERVNSYDELFKRVSDDILSDNNNSGRGHSGTVVDAPNNNNGQAGGQGDVASSKGYGDNVHQEPVRDVRTGGRGRHDTSGSVGELGMGSGRVASQTEPRTDTRESGGVRGGLSSSNTSGRSNENDGTSDGKGGSGRFRPVGELPEPVNPRTEPLRTRLEEPQQKRELGTEKVPYRKQSSNPFDLQSQMPAEQAEVVKKALEDIGDVDEFLVRELGYSSVEDMYHGSQDPSAHGGLAAEQIDSVALAIHQMKNGGAFIIGDQTGIGKGRQGASLIRWGVKQGGNPVYITKNPELFSGVYRDLKDIGSKGLRPFILAADGNKAADITDKGEVVYKAPTKKEKERVLNYIKKNGKLPPEYDFLITNYDSFGNGTMDYENGQKKARSFGKKNPGPAAYNGQAKRDMLEALAGNSYVIMDESHMAGGDSARGNFLQYITTKAKGITFISATFAKRPDNMPIYSLRTAISKAGVKVEELIDAVKRGGTPFQEIMSKALTEAGQMIRRERDMTGVTIDWKGIEDEAVIEKQRQQYDTIIGLFNDIIDFQRRYVDPIVNKKNDEAADEQGEVDHTPGTRDMGINNTPFASRTHQIVKKVLLSLKAEEGAKRAIEHLKAGLKPVIALENTNEGAADRVTGGLEGDMEMPDLSISLKEGLQGTLRISKKDAFGNSTNEMIPFDELSEAGQARYREIMDAIDNASSGLSLSPIDIIKNKLKKAGYKVGELTGRQQEFVYNEDGTVKRVKRQDRDKKKVAEDFNQGRLDAVILNRSAGTGIDLHAGLKFADQKPRIMIVVQAQADVNDEVQMRGRIDRTGQVQHGMYEYVVSQIPSEQRLLMMLKAELSSLDANTTSSQKSKFNEMQVQDIINKYGDEIVIQYLSEHPDLAAKMVDPLKWGDSLGDNWDSMPSETLVTNAKKEGEEGKTASKVLGRMALLKVREQEKMLDEIGDLYQAEIDRLNEMGENDLEITEMPLRAKTLKKDVWEEGTEPGGKNPFADNSYVEEVEMDVLRKPMKAEEVKKSQARLLDGKTWEEYKQAQLDKVEKWTETKKEETRKTITERAEKKATAEKEKYAKGAKKAQEKNGMTDAEIDKNAQYQYDTFYNQEMGKLDSALEAIDKQAQAFIDAVEKFSTDGVYALPTDIYDLGQLTFEPSFGKVIDIKITDNFSTTASTISFATLDGRRKITIPISGMVKQNNGEKRDIKPLIVQQTAQARNGMFGSNVANMLKVLEQNVDNWDKLTSTATRKKGYIITGNLLKALTSLQKQHQGGKLISFTTDTGEIRQGVLMGDRFDPGALTSKNPISSKKDELQRVRDEIKSADGDVSIRVGNWDGLSGGFNTLELTVPKSKKKGEKYFNDETLLGLMDGQFEGSSKLKAEFSRANLDAVLKRLDELGVTVESSMQYDAKRMITTSDPMEAINQAAESWRQSNGKTATNSKLQEISDMVNGLSSRSDLKGSAPTYTINSRQDLEAMKGKVSSRVYREIERLYADPDNGAAYIPRAGIVVVFGEHLEDAKEAEAAWWHEQTHSFWQKLPEDERRKFGYACFDWLRKNRPDIYNHITKPGNYERYDWLNEACAFLIGNVAIESNGTEKFLNGNFVGNPEICNFANELRKHIRNGRQESTNTGNNQLRRIGEGEQTPGTQVRGSSQQGQGRGDNIVRPEEESELSEDPLEAIEQSAKLWRRERRDRENGENTPLQQSAKAVYDDDIDEPLEDSVKRVYEETLDTKAYVATESFQDSMLALKVFQNSALKKGETIANSQNAYQAENLMHGKSKNEMDLFNAEHRKGLEKLVHKILKTMGWQMREFNMYLLTKSGLERNREFFVRDWLERERRKSIKSYDDLNPEEQDIYNRKAETIETLFEDGDIETEEQKENELAKALQEVHNDYIEDVENGWLGAKSKWDSMSFPEYLESLDAYIRSSIYEDYVASEHDYSGLTEMYGDENEEYDEETIIDDLMNAEDGMNGLDDGTVGELWDRIRAANQYALERYRESGMRTDEQIDRIEQMFHWYVPMRGFDRKTGEDVYQYFTSKAKANDYVGGLIKHARGRRSMANSPMATMFAMAYKAISDSNENKMKQYFYRFCQAHPNDLVVMREAWVRLNDVTGEWKEAWPEIPEDATDEQIREAIKVFDEENRQLASEGKAKKVNGKAKFDYKPIDKKHQAEHTVAVMINGQKKLMTIVGNPRLAQALNGHTKWENGKNIISRANAYIKNKMAAAFTSYSPTFALRNMLRDWTHFAMMLNAREGKDYAAAALKYYKETLPRPYHGKGKTGMVALFKKYRAGTLDMNIEVERDFKDFMDNGGVTGFVHMQKVDRLERELKKAVGDRSATGKAEDWIIDNLHLQKVIDINSKVWDYLLGFIEAYNEAIENNARFATYRASRHYAGRTKARSAYDAKEITVNFNRKGSGYKIHDFKTEKTDVKLAAQTAGVTSQVVGEGRIFFNATIQAICTTFKNFKNPDGSYNWKYIAAWAGKYALPPFMLGMLLPFINQMLAAMFGTDGDDDPYANLPDWVRRNNICLYVGKGWFITIPVGPELAAFLTLGDIAAANLYKPELKPVDKDWMDEVNGIMTTFSPIDLEQQVTNGGMFSKDMPMEAVGKTFSVLTPLISISSNRSWMGRPIYREDIFSNDQYTPEYQMVYQSTNPLLVAASKRLHEIGGGDDIVRGMEITEVNPAIVQYLWEQYTGGPGKVFSNTISIGKDVKDILSGNESDFNIRKVEGLKAFVQQGDDRTAFFRASAKYYKYKADAEKLYHDIKGYEKAAKAGDPLAGMKLNEASKGVEYTRMKLLRAADKHLSRINKDANKAEGKERKELRREYNRQMKAVVDELDSVRVLE